MRSSFSFLEHVWTAIKLGPPSTFGHFPKKSSHAFPLETLKSWTKTREESWGQLRRLMVVAVQPGLEVWRGRSGYKELLLKKLIYLYIYMYTYVFRKTRSILILYQYRDIFGSLTYILDRWTDGRREGWIDRLAAKLWSEVWFIIGVPSWLTNDSGLILIC
jgi:hypothetical protein